MNKKLVSMLLIALLVGLSFGGTFAQTPTPPWRLFTSVNVPGATGDVSVMLVPGESPNTWVIIVGGTTPWAVTPYGVTPPNPPGPSDLVAVAKKLATDEMKKLPQDANLAADVKVLSEIYKGIAAQVPDPLDTIDKLIMATRYARESGLAPARVPVWEPWVKAVGTWLQSQKDAGKIKTAQDCKLLWIAIGEGLVAPGEKPKK